MELTYDLHLHSCLSPCGDADMTPYNLVNMAKLLELDIIALTDHNTCGNCRSAMRAGEDAGVVVVPGMELCTAEEIHSICLFPDIDSAEAFSDYVHTTLPPVKNKPEVFGSQLRMDHLDHITGEEDLLLVTASSIDIARLPTLIREYGGTCYPAHIDRASYSILATLGTISPDMGFRCAEISKSGDPAALKMQHPALRDMRIIRSSDAHYLHDMMEAQDHITLSNNSPAELINKLIDLYI